MPTITFRDDDTGEEIVIFERRGKWVIYLREARTKVFIERTGKFTIRAYSHMKYDKNKAKYLELDMYSSTTITEDILNQKGFILEEEVKRWLSDIEDALIDGNHDMTIEHFGDYIEEQLSDDGWSYYSIREDIEYNDVYWKATYKHSPTESPHTLDDYYNIEV